MTDKVFEDKKRYIDQVTKDLDRNIVGLSEQLLKVIIQEFVDKLDRNGDVILNNSKNLKLIAAIDNVYQKFMGQVGEGIAKRIVDSSSRIMGFNNDYYSQFKKTEAAYKNSTAAVEKLINDRLGIGEKVKLVEGGYMDSLLKDPTAKNAIKNLSYKEVLKGSGFKGFKKGLEKLIVGDETKYGAFRQHYRNYAYDSFVQVDRDQTMLLAKDLDLKYFIYEGTVIDTSRPFCIKRAGEVFSIEESKDWVNDPWIQKNLDKGYITSYNPITDAGLFGCRHITRFISKEAAEMLRPELKKLKPPVLKEEEDAPSFFEEKIKEFMPEKGTFYDTPSMRMNANRAAVFADEMKKIGYNVTKAAYSSTDFGDSFYMKVLDKRGDSYKIRSSDHSVTNFNRLTGEIHIGSKTAVKGILDDFERMNFPDRYEKTETDKIGQSVVRQNELRTDDKIIEERFSKKTGEKLFVVNRVIGKDLTYKRKTERTDFDGAYFRK